MGIDENKAVVRQYLAGMHAAPPDLKVFDELLAPNYEGDRDGQKAFASALHAAIGEQIFEIVDMVAKGTQWRPGSNTGLPPRRDRGDG